MAKVKEYREFGGKRYLLGFSKEAKRDAQNTAGYQRSIGRLARVTRNPDKDSQYRWQV